MNLILRDVFVILVLCNISVCAIKKNCTTIEVDYSDERVTISAKGLCECMEYTKPLNGSHFTETVKMDFIDGSLQSEKPEEICKSAGFAKSDKVKPNPAAQENSTTDTTSNTSSTITENTTEPSNVSSDNTINTTDPSNVSSDITNNTTEPSNVSSNITINTTDPSNVSSDITNNTTEPSNVSSDITNNTTEPSNVSSNITINTTDPSNVSSDITNNTTEPSNVSSDITNNTTEPSNVSSIITNNTTEPSSLTTDVTTTSASNGTQPEGANGATSELSKRSDTPVKGSTSTVIFILFASLIAGCLFAAATKFLYNKYKSKEYVLPPDQQEMDSRPNGNAEAKTEETRVEL